jgi:hypothetical protein
MFYNICYDGKEYNEGILGLKYHPLEKANAIADCFKNQFTPNDLCDENDERRVEARVQALLESVDGSPREGIRTKV